MNNKITCYSTGDKNKKIKRFSFESNNHIKLLSELVTQRIYIHPRQQSIKDNPRNPHSGGTEQASQHREAMGRPTVGEAHALGLPMSMLEGGLPPPGEVQTVEPMLLGAGALDFTSKPLSKEILVHHFVTSSIRKAYLNFPSEMERLPEAQNIPASALALVLRDGQQQGLTPEQAGE